MSLATLHDAYRAGDIGAVLAEIHALDAAGRQAVLGRARLSSYGMSASTDELGHFAFMTAVLLVLLDRVHPKAAALRSELTRLRVRCPIDGARLPLPGAAFTGFPLLERLEIEDVVFDTPLDLRRLPRLAYASLTDVALVGLEVAPNLERLYLRGVTGLASLTGLAPGARQIWVGRAPDLVTVGPLDGLPRLEDLTVSEAPALRALGGGRAPALRELALQECPGLDGLADLPEMPGLRRLELSDLSLRTLRGLSLGRAAELILKRCGVPTLEGLPPLHVTEWAISEPALESLAGLEALPSLTQLTVEAPTLGDLSALARLPALTHLTLSGVPLRDLGALRDCRQLEHLTLRTMNVDLTTLPTRLRSLDLRGCAAIADVSGLTRQADLRALALYGTGVTAETLPAALTWAASWEEHADVPKLARRARPKAGAKPKVDPGLLEDLVSRDAAVAAAALQRLDTSGFEELLKHARVVSGEVETTHPLLQKLPHAKVVATALALHAPADMPRAAELREGSLVWKPGEHLSGRWPLDAALLAAFPSPWRFEIRGVALSGAQALAGHPVRSMVLDDVTLDAPEVIGSLPSLQYLTLRRTPVAGVAFPASLEVLTLEETQGLADLREVAAANARSITLRAQPSLRTLDGIERFAALRSLHLERVPALGSLAALGVFPELETVWVTFAGALRDLAGLPPARTVRISACEQLVSLTELRPSDLAVKLELHACAELSTLEGLEVWSGLRTLEAGSCPRLTDVSALDGHPTLQGVDVRRSAALRSLPLGRCGALRAVLVYGTAVDVETVPEPIRWACTSDAYANLEKLMVRVPPTPKSAATVEKGQLQAILKLLRAPDVESVDQGLELLRALDDPGMWDALLDGAELEASARGNRSLTRLVSKRFSGTFAPYVVLGVLHAAPATCARAETLRAGLLGYTTYGTRDEKGRRPFDPMHLVGLPRLVQVSLDRVGPFVQKQGVPSLPTLRNVHLDEVNGLSDLWWLADAPELEQVSLWSTPVRRIDALAGAPRLRKLHCRRNPLADLSPLLTMPALQEVAVGYADPPPPVITTLLERGVSVSRSW